MLFDDGESSAWLSLTPAQSSEVAVGDYVAIVPQRLPSSAADAQVPGRQPSVRASCSVCLGHRMRCRFFRREVTGIACRGRAQAARGPGFALVSSRHARLFAARDFIGSKRRCRFPRLV